MTNIIFIWAGKVILGEAKLTLLLLFCDWKKTGKENILLNSFK